MKAVIALLFLLMAYWLAKQLLITYQKAEKEQPRTEQSAPAEIAPAPSSTLPGLPPSLESSLAAAEKQGAAGLRNWLNTYRGSVQDPRLASIELDYVVLIIRQDPAEARRIFNQVKNRTATFSPIYDRVKRLEKTFQ